MPKVLVLFSSRTGHTARLAEAVAEGARSVRFMEVDIRRVPEPTAGAGGDAGDDASRAARERLAKQFRALEAPERLADYDALILGGPTRYGVMPAELALVLEQAAPLWRAGRLRDKVGSAFTSTLEAHGGGETALWSMMLPMASFGMILVPPGAEVGAGAGSPYGAIAAVAPGDAGPGEAALAAARRQGARVATVTEWVTHAQSHAHGAHHHH